MRQEGTELFPPLSASRTNIGIREEQSEILFQPPIDCVLQGKGKDSIDRLSRNTA